MTQKDPISEQEINPIHSEDYPFWLRAPFRLLTDVTQFRKVDPWDLEIADLIKRFVENMKLLDDINFPVLGRAILSATILYRAKVSDLIRLIEETDDQKEDLEALGFDIPEISPSYHISQRPVTFNELIYAFQGLLKQEARYQERLESSKRKAFIKPLQLPAEPIKIIEEESTKIEKLKQDVYRELVRLHEKHKRPIAFEELLKPNTTKVNIVRIFLCILFLTFEIKAELRQNEDLGKIYLVPIRDNEEEFLGELEKIIEKKLKEGEDVDRSVTVSEVEYGDDDFLEEIDEYFDDEEEEEEGMRETNFEYDDIEED